MIKVIARSSIKTNNRKEVLALYEILVQKTRQEPQCISYELYQDLEKENNLMLIEEWENKDALMRHTETSHFIDIVTKLSQYETELPVEVYKKVY